MPRGRGANRRSAGTILEITAHDENLSGLAVQRPERRSTASNPYRVEDSRLWYEWTFFEKIRPYVKVPVLAKGILTPEDALLCLDHGVDGVYVSNHGGRSLDYAPSTLEVLPEIVDAVRGRVPVLFVLYDDFAGEPTFSRRSRWAPMRSVWAVYRCGDWARSGRPACNGVLEILQAELVQAMIDAGRPTLASIDRSLVRTRLPMIKRPYSGVGQRLRVRNRLPKGKLDATAFARNRRR